MIWQAFLSFFTGGGVSGIAKELRLAHEAKLNAANEIERLEADQNIARIESHLAAQTQGSATWLPKVMRALWAAPFVLYVWKLIIWDKMLGWGVTDPLGVYEVWVGQAIVSFYFVTGAVQVLRK